MPHHILVVDDAPDSSEPLAKLLRRSGYTVDVADGGTEALGRLEDVSPQLIILDLGMPGMDGYGFLEALRGLPQCSTVKVLVFTAHHDADVDRLKRLGVSAVCRKTYTPFLAVIKHVGDCLGTC